MNVNLDLDELERLAKSSPTYWFGEEMNLKLSALARKGQARAWTERLLAQAHNRAERYERALREIDAVPLTDRTSPDCRLCKLIAREALEEEL